MKLLELSKPSISVKNIASSNWQRNLSGGAALLMKLFELLKPGVFCQEDCTGTHKISYKWQTNLSS